MLLCFSILFVFLIKKHATETHHRLELWRTSLCTLNDFYSTVCVMGWIDNTLKAPRQIGLWRPTNERRFNGFMSLSVHKLLSFWAYFLHCIVQFVASFDFLWNTSTTPLAHQTDLQTVPFRDRTCEINVQMLDLKVHFWSVCKFIYIIIW